MNTTSWPQTQHEGKILFHLFFAILEYYNGLWEEKFSNRDRTEDPDLFKEIIKSAPIVISKIGFNI